MKTSARLIIFACAFAVVGCAHHRAPSHKIPTTSSTQPVLDAHDDLIIEMLARFDFGGGITLADMSDEEFDDMMSKGDERPGALGDTTPPTRAEYLMRQARQRALDEASAPPQSPSTTRTAK